MSVMDSLDKAFEASSIEDSDEGITIEPIGVESSAVVESVESDSDETDPNGDAAGSQNLQAESDLDPPADWDDEAKEKFRKAPSEWKPFLLERAKFLQGQHTRRMQEAQRKYQDYDETIDPFLPQLQELGYTPGQAFKQLMTVQQMLDQNPEGTLRWLANSYGINLASPQQQVAPHQQIPQPVVQVLERELGPIRQWISGQQRIIQEQQRATEEAQVQSLASELTAFGQEKDEFGNFKRPYFAEVIPAIQTHVAQLLQSEEYAGKDPKEITHAAYELAVKPFKKMIDAEKKKSSELAKKAAAASSPRSGGGAASVQNGKKRSTLDSLDAAFAQHSRA